MAPLEALGFALAGYGCTTCIGNSGPLDEAVAGGHRGERPRRRGGPVGQPQLRGPHPPARPRELPRLAAAGRGVRARRPGRHRPDAASRSASARTAPRSSSPTSGRRPTRSARSSVGRSTRSCSGGPTRSCSRATSAGGRCRSPTATATPGIRRRRTSRGRRSSMGSRPARPAPGDIDGARVLAVLGDSVTTDHISPAGSIAPWSPAGQWLQEHGVGPLEFNSYGARRGHHEVMMRGTFGNIRLRNRLVEPKEGPYTVHLPSGEETFIYDAAMRYASRGRAARRDRRPRVRVRLVARLGGQGPALLGVRAVHRRELRADPPLQPRRDGHPAAPVPAGRQRGLARPDRARDVSRSRASPAGLAAADA